MKLSQIFLLCFLLFIEKISAEPIKNSAKNNLENATIYLDNPITTNEPIFGIKGNKFFEVQQEGISLAFIKLIQQIIAPKSIPLKELLAINKENNIFNGSLRDLLNELKKDFPEEISKDVDIAAKIDGYRKKEAEEASKIDIQKDFDALKQIKKWNKLYAQFKLSLGLLYIPYKGGRDDFNISQVQIEELTNLIDQDKISITNGWHVLLANQVFPLLMPSELKIDYKNKDGKITVGSDFQSGNFISNDIINLWFAHMQTNAHLSNGIVTKTISDQLFDEIKHAAKTKTNIVLVPYHSSSHFRLIVINKIDYKVTLIDSLDSHSRNLQNQIIAMLKENKIPGNWQPDCWNTRLQHSDHGNSCGIHVIVYATIIAKLGKFDHEVKQAILSLQQTRPTLQHIGCYGTEEDTKKTHPGNRGLFNQYYRKELQDLIKDSSGDNLIVQTSKQQLIPTNNIDIQMQKTMLTSVETQETDERENIIKEFEKGLNELQNKNLSGESSE